MHKDTMRAMLRIVRRGLVWKWGVASASGEGHQLVVLCITVRVYSESFLCVAPLCSIDITHIPSFTITSILAHPPTSKWSIFFHPAGK